jgi:hypothetical protein
MGVLCNPEKCSCQECKNTILELEKRNGQDDFLNEFEGFIS